MYESASSDPIHLRQRDRLALAYRLGGTIVGLAVGVAALYLALALRVLVLSESEDAAQIINAAGINP